MLTRLMFGGGTAQVLIMQAGSSHSTSGYSYGYSSSSYGSLTPSYITYKGTKYDIILLRTGSKGKSVLQFKSRLPSNVTTITIEVEGVRYRLSADGNTNYYVLDHRIFTRTGTYKIKILSLG